MRWELIKATEAHEVYHLFKDEQKILSLELNPFSNSARVECNNEKRVFLIRKEGLRRNKTVIRNEYGIRVGELGEENRNHFIDVNGERFYFKTSVEPRSELILYKESDQQPLLTCSISEKKGGPELHLSKDKKLSGEPHPGLLIGLCWYMFLPVAKEKTTETVLSL